MEKYIEVMKKSLELADTIQEGIQHIQTQLGEGKREQTVFLFEDILVAYSTIESTVEPVISELGNESIRGIQTELNKVVNLVVTAYEEKNYTKIQEVLQFSLAPQFKKLKKELEKTFSPYLLS